MSIEGSGVGQGHSPDQDGGSAELSHVYPRNRNLPSSGRSGPNDAIVSAPEERNNFKDSGVGDDHG